MKVLDYYFILEYQWKEKWFSEFGICKPKISASNEFVQKNGFIDYSIINSIIILDRRLNNVEMLNNLLDEMKMTIDKNNIYYIGSDIASMDINSEFSMVFDLMGNTDIEEKRLTWNDVTPYEFQMIPTSEIFELLHSWRNFLLEVIGKNRSNW
jgi:hypothetical protein